MILLLMMILTRPPHPPHAHAVQPPPVRAGSIGGPALAVRPKGVTAGAAAITAPGKRRKH